MRGGWTLYPQDGMQVTYRETRTCDFPGKEETTQEPHSPATHSPRPSKPCKDLSWWMQVGGAHSCRGPAGWSQSGSMVSGAALLCGPLQAAQLGWNHWGEDSPASGDDAGLSSTGPDLPAV